MDNYLNNQINATTSGNSISEPATSKSMSESVVVDSPQPTAHTQGAEVIQNDYTELPSVEKQYAPKKLIVRKYQLYKSRPQ